MSDDPFSRGGRWPAANQRPRRFAGRARRERRRFRAGLGWTRVRCRRCCLACPEWVPRLALHERGAHETLLSLVHRVCRLKYLWHRAAPYLDAHLAYVAALVNALL